MVLAPTLVTVGPAHGGVLAVQAVLAVVVTEGAAEPVTSTYAQM